MKNNMEEIDKLIKETLTNEEAKFYDELDEQGLLGMVKGVFTGKLKWLIVLMLIMKFIIFGTMIYCVVQFFSVEDTNELIKWGLGSVVLGLMMSMLKLFSWMQMDKNALIREIKRLELLISSQAHK